MAYDEKLAERIRALLNGKRNIAELNMFGGICFTLNGNMAVGINDDVVMARVGPDVYEACLKQAGARVMDFYFLARVVSARGDQSHFTYDADPFLDPRFATFLRAYHEVSPLGADEVTFLREAYRFFLLNYAVLEAEHFFRPELCDALRRDVVELHLPALTELDLSPLLDAIA